MSFDTVIRNGIVVDGTGLAPFRADVSIVGGRIAGVGRIKERGATDIDAEGHVVTPGFIDATRTWTRRCSGTSSARTRAGTASPRS